jgi:C1A family cysteine protease
MILIYCSVVGTPQGNSAVVTNHQPIHEVFFTDQNNRNDCGCDNQETITFPVSPLYRTGLLPGGPAGSEKMIITGVTPSSWDWRNAKYNGITGDWTTGIRNQGNCGSCYAFGAIAALESVNNIARNNPNVDVDLSEQFIVSCGQEWMSGIFGCNGGYFTSTFTFVKTYGAIPETCFPYTSGESGYVPPCSQKCSNWQDLVLNIDDWRPVASDIDSMKNALITYGPLTVTLTVYDDFQHYNGGVYEHPGNDPDPTNHMVAIVGYDDAHNCWICKNSWGTAWGENGWFRIVYGDCNIGQETATFTVTNVNHPPAVSSIPGQTIKEGSTFAIINLDDYVTDIDNTDAEMTWTYSGNSQLTVSIVNRVASIGIPNPDWNGAETITFRATDPGSLWDDDTATFTVTNVNHPPAVSGIPDQIIEEGATFAIINLDDYVTDIDNTDAQMTWTYSGNSQLTVSIVARVATITIPNLDWNGAETITFRATDPGSLWDDDTATFTVTTKANQPPNPPTITGPASGNVSTAYDYYFMAIDPDDDEVYFFMDWGDNTNSSWIGPYPSGEQITKSHTWSTKATYTVKVKAKDIYGNESYWGTLEVTMPKGTTYIPSLFLELIERLLERFPHAFPILRQLLRY